MQSYLCTSKVIPRRTIFWIILLRNEGQITISWAGKQYVGMKRSELLLQSGVYRRVHPALYIRILSRFLHLHARPPSNSLSCFFSPRVSEEREETLFSSLPSSLHKVSRGVATRAWAVGRLHFLADHYFSLTPTRACGQHARTQTHTSPDGCTCTPGGLRIFSLFAPATTLPFPSSRELGVSRCILMKKFVTSLRHPAAAATAAEAAPAKKERVGKRNERFLIVVGSLLFPLAAASISLRLLLHSVWDQRRYNDTVNKIFRDARPTFFVSKATILENEHVRHV